MFALLSLLLFIYPAKTRITIYSKHYGAVRQCVSVCVWGGVGASAVVLNVDFRVSVVSFIGV